MGRTIDPLTNEASEDTMTTATTITDSQIRALRSEASTAQDWDQVAICDVAIAGVAMGHTVEAAGRTWTQDEARAECQRVIGDAQAQQDA